jgi:hypothetical protein
VIFAGPTSDSPAIRADPSVRVEKSANAGNSAETVGRQRGVSRKSGRADTGRFLVPLPAQRRCDSRDRVPACGDPRIVLEWRRLPLELSPEPSAALMIAEAQ